MCGIYIYIYVLTYLLFNQFHLGHTKGVRICLPGCLTGWLPLNGCLPRGRAGSLAAPLAPEQEPAKRRACQSHCVQKLHEICTSRSTNYYVCHDLIHG